MSRYLKFILERSGAPTPRRVLVVQHDLEWANRQIEDEFRFLFEGVRVTTGKSGALTGENLIVLPYVGGFLAARPGGVAFYRHLRSVNNVWVLIYGLDFRLLEVVRGQELYRYYCRRWFLRQCLRGVRGLCLRRPMGYLIRSWREAAT